MLCCSGGPAGSLRPWCGTLAGHAGGVKVGGGECQRSPGPLRLIRRDGQGLGPDQRSGGVANSTGHVNWVNSVAVSANGRLALSASSDGTVKVWDLTSGQELRTLAGHGALVNPVAMSGDGRLALPPPTTARSGCGTRRPVSAGGTPRGHADGVHSVAVTPTAPGPSASDDRTVKLWDLTSGQELRTLAGHAYGVNSVVVSADGRLALSGSDDNTVKVWDLTSGQVLAPSPATRSG